ncbi:MAG: multidrug efflux pump [Desulfovibrionales bacterium]|nr:multidrug efflux pump [Desulfovibrionales bacterium]
MVRFFIDRPIFAMVVSIVITLAGTLALLSLPIAQYPEITPPTVQVTATYTGANAQVVEETVATPIEQQVNGAQDMLYMDSISSNDGRMVLTVTFDIGRDLELAQVDVQNRVSLATPKLPDDVTRAGVSVKKQSPNMLLAINLISPDHTYDTLFLNNYATINIMDNLARLPGVGDVNVFGTQDYSMRIWLDPDKMTRLKLTSADVINAVQEQNVQAAAGQVGQPPVSSDVKFQYTVQVKGRLADPEEFADIIVRANQDGSTVRIRDIGSVEMGAQTYNTFSRLNSGPACSILIYQLPGANALQVVEEVRAKMKEMAQYFPPGVEYHIPYDTTLFVNSSIEEVLHTLYEAIFLVFIVVFVFLQNWRATLVPMIAVPVSLIGTFIFFPIFGFSINTLTLFGLVLAIGLVVDDAIVVVEGVQRYIDEEKLSPYQATIKTMHDVAAPVVANSLVLIAVFVPVAFMGGISGRLYQQFALTLSVAVAISTLNALTLSPALSALLLRPVKPARGPLGWFFAKFNNAFDKVTNGYKRGVQLLMRRAIIGMAFIAFVVAGCWGMLKILPTGFVPEEDQGYFLANVQLPPAASLERTNQCMRKMEAYLKKAPGVQDVLTLGGLNLLNNSYSSYAGSMFIILKPWSERTTPELSVQSIIQKAQQYFWTIDDGLILCFNPPAIQGLGTTGGFQFELQDRAGGTVKDLTAQASSFMTEAGKKPDLQNLFTTFSDSVPQFYVDIDRDKVKKLGIPLNNVFMALQTFLGGYYINDFNKYGRTYQVMAEAESKYREKPSDIGRFYVRSSDDQMAPLSTLANVQEITGPEYIQHHNLYRTVEITGAAKPGFSSGDAIKTMQETAASVLPMGFGYEWTGMAYQEIAAGQDAPLIFGLAVVMVFLFLAALYESWAIPFAVLLALPLGILGALLGQYARGLDNNVYAQIGLVMLLGLAAKNAVLIVEYAKNKREEGYTAAAAALEAAHLRFRPILMTSFAFILGVVPLVAASGAGAASRHSLGTSVFVGMIFATCLGVFMIPDLYNTIQGATDKKRNKKPTNKTPADEQ